jgi:ABC-type sugar transport system ATPase subunit
LQVAAGELLALVGPSGCGKTTTLRLIAGLERPDQGRVYIGGSDVTDLPARRRHVALVSQTSALYPHLCVADNLAFGLRLRSRSDRATARAEIEAVVRQTAQMLAIEHLLARMPWELSGGERQRVSLGRALARRPDVLLLDEPLAQLDAELRQSLRREIRRIQRETQTTTVLVTHDPQEALAVGDRIAVISAGRIEQVGTPREVYERPQNRTVARIVGWPPMNLVRGRLEAIDGRAWFADGQRRAPLTQCDTEPAGREVWLGVRPEHVRLEPADATSTGAWSGTVELVEPGGVRDLVRVLLPAEAGSSGCALECAVAAPAGCSRGQPARASVQIEKAHIFDAASGFRLKENHES